MHGFLLRKRNIRAVNHTDVCIHETLYCACHGVTGVVDVAVAVAADGSGVVGAVSETCRV